MVERQVDEPVEVAQNVGHARVDPREAEVHPAHDMAPDPGDRHAIKAQRVPTLTRSSGAAVKLARPSSRTRQEAPGPRPHERMAESWRQRPASPLLREHLLDQEDVPATGRGTTALMLASLSSRERRARRSLDRLEGSLLAPCPSGRSEKSPTSHARPFRARTRERSSLDEVLA